MPFISNLITSILAFHVSGCGDMCRVWSSYKTTKGKVHFRVKLSTIYSQVTGVNYCRCGLLTKHEVKMAAYWSCCFVLL